MRKLAALVYINLSKNIPKFNHIKKMIKICRKQSSLHNPFQQICQFIILGLVGFDSCCFNNVL